MAVVLYLSSTSNHNCPRSSDMTLWLCYIFLLHQTTTSRPKRASCCSCVISFFYIKPQLFCGVDAAMWCCVISFFYIKPQLWLRVRYVNWCCVISFFYIKPQLVGSCGCRCCVVLYLSSTSNHNFINDPLNWGMLCYIFLLHQTTTHPLLRKKRLQLCYIFLLHQTTTGHKIRIEYARLCYIFLLHQTTTILLKPYYCSWLCYIFLLHQTTTYTTNLFVRGRLCYIFLLHQTTTSVEERLFHIRLCYIFLLHQTTTTSEGIFNLKGCVISFFYIKPQPIWDNPLIWKLLKDSFVYRKWCWCVTFYGQKY